MSENTNPCANGHQYPLDWHSAKYRQMLITNQPREMMMAAGWGSIAKWNGFCVRCGDSVEWSSHRPPRRERYRRPRTCSHSALPPRGTPDGGDA